MRKDGQIDRFLRLASSWDTHEHYRNYLVISYGHYHYHYYSSNNPTQLHITNITILESKLTNSIQSRDIFYSRFVWHFVHNSWLLLSWTSSYCCDWMSAHSGLQEYDECSYNGEHSDKLLYTITNVNKTHANVKRFNKHSLR